MKKIKILTFGTLAMLMMSLVHLPAAYAVDNCFVTMPRQENIMSDPAYSDVFYVGVASACEMKLYDMDVSFTGIDAVEGLIEVYSDNHDDLSNVEYLEDGLRLKWNGKEDEREDVDYVEFDSAYDSWDYLFGRWYIIPISSLNPPTTFKRNMPVTINSAHYEADGEMKEVKNLVLNTVLVKAPDSDKDVLMISGVEKQSVTFTDHPVVLEGELTVEENNDGITAEDLTEQYYTYDDSDLSFTPIERPTDPGEFYLVEYSFENDNYRASLRVPFVIKDYIIATTRIFSGQGSVGVPTYVDKGGNLHVEIEPGEGYEIVWVEHNDNDVTDLLNDDNTLDIEGVNENAEIVVAFRRVYQVTDGDGGEHIRGSGDDLPFVVDKDPASYTEGEVTIDVDGEPVDLMNDSVVTPETKTTTLLSEYLDTLETGSHNVVIYFHDDGAELAGIARASFTVVEADEPVPGAPNTGSFASDNNAAKISELTTTTLAAIITLAALGLALIKKIVKL